MGNQLISFLLLVFCVLSDGQLFGKDATNSVQRSTRSASTIASKTIELAAIGRDAHLGELYDARDDKFLVQNLISEKIPEGAINSQDCPNTKLKFIMEDSYSEKFNKLDVKAELKLSVLTGKLSLGGLGEYLSEKKQTTKVEKISLLYSMTTKHEELLLKSEKLASLYNFGMLDGIEATHIVVGIQYGGKVILTAEHSVTDSKDEKKVAGMLKAAFKKITFAIEGNVNVTFGENEIEKSDKFTFKFKGDAAEDMPTPQNIKEAAELVKNIPNYVSKKNGGKGSAVKYVLLPLSTLKVYFDELFKPLELQNQIEEAVVEKFVDLFDEIENCRAKINYLVNLVEKWDCCLNENFKNEVKTVNRGFSDQEKKFKEEIHLTLRNVRSGRLQPSQLEALIADYSNKDYSHIKVSEKIKRLNRIQRVTNVLDIMASFKVQFIRYDSLKNTISLNRGIEMRIFHFTPLTKENGAIYKSKIKKILRLLERRVNSTGKIKYIAVIDEKDAKLQKEKAVKMSVYMNGQLKHDDYLDADENGLAKKYIIYFGRNGRESSLIDMETQEVKEIPFSIGENVRAVGVVDEMLYAFESTISTQDVERCQMIKCTPIRDIYDERSEWADCGRSCGRFEMGITRIGKKLYTLSDDGVLSEFDTTTNTTTVVRKFEPNMTKAHYMPVLTNNQSHIYAYKHKLGPGIFLDFDLERNFVSDLQEPKVQNAGLAMINNKLCLIGGNELKGKEPLRGLECMDPQNGEWSSNGAKLYTPRDNVITVEDNGAVYILPGGLSDSNTDYGIQKYDPVGNKWKLLKSSVKPKTDYAVMINVFE